jgi:hypothetical protein
MYLSTGCHELTRPLVFVATIWYGMKFSFVGMALMIAPVKMPMVVGTIGPAVNWSVYSIAPSVRVLVHAIVHAHGRVAERTVVVVVRKVAVEADVVNCRRAVDVPRAVPVGVRALVGLRAWRCERVARMVARVASQRPGSMARRSHG